MGNNGHNEANAADNGQAANIVVTEGGIPPWLGFLIAALVVILILCLLPRPADGAKQPIRTRFSIPAVEHA